MEVPLDSFPCSMLWVVVTGLQVSSSLGAESRWEPPVLREGEGEGHLESLEEECRNREGVCPWGWGLCVPQVL